jgi:hypothetical protein
MRGGEIMRKTALVFGLLAAAAVWPTAHAATETYRATLNGASESPPIQSAGAGAASINVDTTTKGLSWRVEYTGLSGPATAAHIHCGAPPGGNAGVAVPLGTAPNWASPLQGNGQMTDAQLAQLQAGQCYVNVHTDANKPGEIRGQLTK